MNAVDYFFKDSAFLDKVFLYTGKEQFSFRNISDKVSRLSGWISNKYARGETVILISPNNEFFVTVYLAVMKAGCVVVPLNPAIEDSNLEFVVSLTGAPLAFVHSSVKIKKIFGVEVYSQHSSMLDMKDDLWHKYEPGVEMGENDLAQIIFTSGSTAMPRGVMISHGNLIANTTSILKYLSLRMDDTMMVVLPFFYCYGLSLLHTHLRVGGSLVLNNNFMFLGSVLRDLKQYQCTGFAGVPSHFQILLRKSESFRNEHFPNLRYVTQAGGKLHNVFIREFVELFPDVKFFVMYGQTEATARLSYLPPHKLSDKIGSIGKGITGVTLKVVDEKGKEVLPGQTGEIIAFGKNIMLGYLGDEGATSEAIVDGWLHTGDLGTVDEDGYIYLTARKKELIKVGGKRVGPKEIEEVIVRLPGVIDCTIEAYDHPDLGEGIRAIVVKKENSTLSAEDIRQECAKKLASFKVPTDVVFKNRMETALTGKKIKGTL
ncbi:class I adenylate-forming enzyme family protein [Thermophagus sp. OGC60D27]|uniref:class I adenylate-forming enzyme family protein n=1 Tax=Thermophagus sp. OGC60D27 TaxID=3458415 RepID=UPI0040383300